ncbi:LysM peptidoglycan-binding domain-containing protein [Williamsia deligens]|uniref:LysM peptidoglycan-binding domain-containing protein n=1 Tax=Williamsia deligens TaxID=321325 RepID=A0ABW3GBK1_9NOCA|nr:LysM peptidoglycan-binding domain-containing protein [Williamsia deligens]MCP2195423.1 hypothetical protein [Williamsia deligens]
MSPTLMAPGATPTSAPRRVVRAVSRPHPEPRPRAESVTRTDRRHPLDPSVRRPGASRPATARTARPAVVGTECRTGSGRGGSVRTARVGWGAAIIAGLALAVAVFAVVVGGSVLTDHAEPAVVGSSVVHVRGGESLSALAARSVPDAPVAQVVADIRELNHLSGSAVTPGQPLLAPRYAR